MKYFPLLAGGIVAGLIIVIGEAFLNLWVLANQWAAVFERFALSQPTAIVAVQGVIKLLILGFFSVWLAITLRPAITKPNHAGMLSGCIVWFLVWAWVQWGMLLAGYVTLNIAIITVIWGLVELPIATWLGTRVHDNLTHIAD